MYRPLRSVAGILTTLALAHSATASINEAEFSSSRHEVIEVDVAIVGGGASGAHAAVRLREDFGKSIVLVEKQKMLGGHVDTYSDPDTGRSYEYGVQNYVDYGASKAFYERFLETTAPSRLSLNTQYVDFSTGKLLDAYISPASSDVSEALAKYLELCELYEDILLPGYWNFPPGNEVPDDLLLPFGEFAKKHGIEAAMPRMFEVTAMGAADYVNELTMYVMQTFGAPLTRVFLGQGSSFVPVRGSNQELYDKIGELLGGDVMYESTVVDSVRSEKGVKLVVKTKHGKKLVKAKRLLTAIQPVLPNMKTFDLDENEHILFAKFLNSRIHAGVVSHPSLPIDGQLDNTPESAVPDNYFAYPELPFIARFDYFGFNSTLWRILAVGGPNFSTCDVQKEVRKAFKKMVKSGVLADTDDSRIQFKALEDHGAMHVHVKKEDIQNDFLRKLYALQGQRSTFYTGGGWAVQFTTALWEFNEVLLPKIVEGL